MTTPPNDLPPVDSVGTGFNYKRYTSLDTSTHYVYKMWRNSANNWRTLSPVTTNTIKVSKTDSTDWSDNDTTDTNPTEIDTTTLSGKVVLSQAGQTSGPNYRFALPNPSWGGGPNVTSITNDTIFVPSDTVSNTDFTLLKNGSAYANSNISLTGPGAQPPSDARGYTYSLTYNGTAVYSRTIDSLSHHAFYWDDSWTSSPSSGKSTNSNRILNVLATIPSYITIGSGSDTNGNPNPLTTVFNNVSRVITHTQTATIEGVSNEIHINFALDNKVINGQLEIIGTFYESRAVNGYTNVSQDYIIGNQQTMTYNQSLLGDTITYYVSDWVYSDEHEGDGYVAPVSTTSDGGGKRRRYPIISTNLFDRQRSIFSIGLTHKDETLF